MTTIPESNRANNRNILYLVVRTSDIAYRGSPWHGTMKRESVNPVGNPRGNKNVKNSEHKNNFEVEKLIGKILLIGITPT